MALRRSIWEQLEESTEGPTVTLQIPRERAEELMQILMAGLEMDDGMGMGDPGLDGEMDDIDADMGMGDVPDDMDSPGFSAGDDDMPDFAAGDDEAEDEPAPPKKKGPPGGKPAKKKGGGDKPEKKKSDDDDSDAKDENADCGDDYRPQTALGESSLMRLARVRSRRR